MAKAEEATRIKEYPKCELRFLKEGKLSPSGFNSVGVNDEVTLIITGTVKEIADSAEEWNPGKRLTVKMNKCNIKIPVKKKSMSDALEETKVKI